MQDATRIYLFLYALLMIVGGVMGAGKGSVMSIVAGAGCGIIAGVGGYLMASNSKLGLILGLGASLLALGGMLPRFLKSHAVWPAGVVVVASALAVVLTAIALATKK